MTEATDHLAFFQRKKRLQPFDIGELLAPSLNPDPPSQSLQARHKVFQLPGGYGVSVV